MTYALDVILLLEFRIPIQEAARRISELGQMKTVGFEDI